MSLSLGAHIPAIGRTPDPAEKEAALGRRLAEDFRQHNTPIDNPDVQHYLNALGFRLAAEMPQVRLPFTFGVVAEAPCNAEPDTLPGAYVFVSTRIFLRATDEYEFARLLAHPMAHIALRHAIIPVTNRMASIPLVFTSGCPAAAPRALQNSRERNEREADALAAETLARAGWGPGKPALPPEEFAAVQQEIRALMAKPAPHQAPPSLLPNAAR